MMVRVALGLVAAALAGGPLFGPLVPPSRDESAPAERLLTAGVQTALSFVLETRVTIERAAVDAEKGHLRLEGLQIENPKGFAAGPVLTLREVLVEAEPDVLTAKEPVVHLVQVRGARVNAQHDIRQGLNLQKLQKSADRIKTPALPLLQPPSAATTTLRLGKAILEECEMTIASPLLLGRPQTVTLDPIEIDYKDTTGDAPIAVDRAVAIAIERIVDQVMAKSNIPNPLEGILPRP